MRLIKFRGQQKYGKDMGEWITVVLGEDSIQNEFSSIYFNNTEVLSCTIGQFSGKNDMKGNQIYAGDIVEAKINDIKYRGQVTFNNSAAFGVWIEEGVKDSNGITHNFPLQHFKNCTVIGNVHDNPELLAINENNT